MIQLANDGNPRSLTTMKQSSKDVTAVYKHKLISSAAEAHCAGTYIIWVLIGGGRETLRVMPRRTITNLDLVFRVRLSIVPAP